jgi:thiazolinyl imide reductase
MRTVRAVVCGTRFGQVYLEAFRRPDNPVELAGIVATGSERSRECARHYGVPLYTDPERVPAGIDLACVVIRGGLLGGRGTELAQAFMARGVSVLQEHPVHHDELAACLRLARRHGVVYHLNSFYVHIAPVRRFLAAAAELLRAHPVRYVDAACGFQLAYSLLDILGTMLRGVRPWRLDASDVAVFTGPFRSIDGVLAGVPLTLRVQNELDPADPDNHAHLMHRVSIGTDAGDLSLVSTHGPTVWCARPRFPEAVGGVHFDGVVGPGGLPSAAVVGAADAPDYETVFRSVWTDGVVGALREVAGAIDAGEDPLARGQYHLTLCRLWQDITARLGPPTLLAGERVPGVSDAELAAIRAAAEEVP